MECKWDTWINRTNLGHLVPGNLEASRGFQGKTMTSPIGCLTTFDDSEYVETWISCFEALARVKKQRDKWSEGKQNEITDMFLATAIQKVSTMVYPRNLEELTFKEIGEVIFFLVLK